MKQDRCFSTDDLISLIFLSLSLLSHLALLCGPLTLARQKQNEDHSFLPRDNSTPPVYAVEFFLGLRD